MADIGSGIVLAFMASLALGGLFCWSWTFYRLWTRQSVMPPTPRLPATWGFAEILVCFGVYLVVTVTLGIALTLAGFDLRGTPSEEVATSAEVAASIVDTSQEASVTAIQVDAEEEADSAAVDSERLGTLIATDGFARLATLLIMMMLLSLFDGRIFERFGWRPRWRHLELGLIGACMLLPPLFGLQALLTRLIPYEHPVLEIIQDQPPLWVLFAMAFTTILVAPLAEEFFFRGLLQGWLQSLAAGITSSAGSSRSLIDRLTDSLAGASDSQAPAGSAQDVNQPLTSEQVAAWPWWPIIVSSLLFALVHLGHGPAPISLFFLAVGLGYLYRLTGSLWPSIVVHMVLNGISTTITILNR